jgi:hypothetical protein
MAYFLAAHLYSSRQLSISGKYVFSFADHGLLLPRKVENYTRELLPVLPVLPVLPERFP